MARNVLKKIFGIGLLLLLLSGCSDLPVYLKVMEGNYDFARGEYMDANFSYLQAYEEIKYRPRISYNLGNVYHSLGETEAAEEQWDSAAEDGADADLQYRIAFNRGVLLYESGRYQEAFNEFRRALLLQPTDFEAKVNLEYSLRKLSSRRGETEGGTRSEKSAEEPEVSEEAKRILEYVRRNTKIFAPGDYSVEEDDDVKDW